MNDIVYKDSFRTLTETLRAELRDQAESFVKAGYLLKAARDTEVLQNSSYASVNEFASAEFGLTADMVSRYIRIYERFGEGEGLLKTDYQGYGVAKLQIMITLPDEVNEQLSPEMSKSQISEVAAEVHEEEKISDMEVMCEDPAENPNLNTIQQFFMSYFKDHKEQFLMVDDVHLPSPSDEQFEEFKEIFFPTGTEMIFARIPQHGKHSLSAKGKLMNIRTGETEEYQWSSIYQEIVHGISTLLNIMFVESDYKELFGEEVAPVQEESPEPSNPSKTEEDHPKKEKVKKDHKKEDPKVEEPEVIPDNEVPGQTILTESGVEVVPTPVEEDPSPDEVRQQVKYEANLKLIETLRKQIMTAYESKRQINWIDAKMTAESLRHYCREMEVQTARDKK